MTRAEAEGTTEATACRFWMVSWTVTLSPFQSPVALAISSPTFLGDYSGRSGIYRYFARDESLRFRLQRPEMDVHGAIQQQIEFIRVV